MQIWAEIAKSAYAKNISYKTNSNDPELKLKERLERF